MYVILSLLKYKSLVKKQDKLIYVYFCDYKKTKNFIHQINVIYDNNLKRD